MKNIEAVYSSYEPVVEYFGRDKISTRMAELLDEAETFLKTAKLENTRVRINELLLTHTVMDYFTDIMRLKEFHPVDLANKYKILAYELFWWLRRKPIQIIDEGSSDVVSINEKFAVSKVIGLFDSIAALDGDEAKLYIASFQDSLYYYLKYRQFTAQDIEMILLSFSAGLYMKIKPQED